jgi:phage shock protein PspC (stress-responsive transcriptional regulator)
VQTIPPPASPAPRVEAFRRSRDDTMLLGVCAGVARALGVAPVWIRLGTLALVAILPALGVLLYALLGVVVRRDDGRLALGGDPPDSRETVVGWGLVALAAYGATTADSGILLPAPRPLLLLACAAAAAVVAQTARRRVSEGDEGTAPPPPPGEEPTEPMAEIPAGATPAGADAAARAPGPSLLAIGIGVLALVAIVGILTAPAGLPAVGASGLIASGAGALGILAIAGVLTAIAFAGRRHAGGLLALSLLVGLLAVGMASVYDQVGSQPAVDWLLRRVGDLLWVNR